MIFITSVFINPDTGDVYKENEILKRPQLANTLRILQEDPDALYTGQLANQLAGDIQGFGGIVTAEDLRNYKLVLIFSSLLLGQAQVHYAAVLEYKALFICFMMADCRILLLGCVFM